MYNASCQTTNNYQEIQMNTKLSTNQLAIVNVLIRLGTLFVATIAEETGLNKSAVSANIKPLRDKGIITTAEVDGVLAVTYVKLEARVETAPAPLKMAPSECLIWSVSAKLAPRQIVKDLIKLSGMTKKAAKRVVYNHAYC
jgi:DNA-binding transcriptional ArsR family regulator